MRRLSFLLCLAAGAGMLAKCHAAVHTVAGDDTHLCCRQSVRRVCDITDGDGADSDGLVRTMPEATKDNNKKCICYHVPNFFIFLEWFMIAKQIIHINFNTATILEAVYILPLCEESCPSWSGRATTTIAISTHLLS